MSKLIITRKNEKHSGMKNTAQILTGFAVAASAIFLFRKHRAKSKDNRNMHNDFDIDFIEDDELYGCNLCPDCCDIVNEFKDDYDGFCENCCEDCPLRCDTSQNYDNFDDCDNSDDSDIFHDCDTHCDKAEKKESERKEDNRKRGDE